MSTRCLRVQLSHPASGGYKCEGLVLQVMGWEWAWHPHAMESILLWKMKMEARTVKKLNSQHRCIWIRGPWNWQAITTIHLHVQSNIFCSRLKHYTGIYILVSPNITFFQTQPETNNLCIIFECIRLLTAINNDILYQCYTCFISDSTI